MRVARLDVVRPALQAVGVSDHVLLSWPNAATAFQRGAHAVFRTILALVLFATYLGIGALAHDSGFSLFWVLLSNLLVWAGPAQIILISTLGSGATPVQAAIAVTLSAIRLLPMVVSVLPMLRTPQTRQRDLIVPAHFIAVTVWAESFRFLPNVPRERRIAFICGFGSGLVVVCSIATIIGFVLAARLPSALSAAILFLTPLSFLLTTARNSARLSDALALLLGLALFPLVAILNTGVDVLISGVGAGTIAYAADRLRRRPT